MYSDRKHLIFSVDELPLVNFAEVLEDGPGTVRRSVSGTRTLVKWDGEEMPPSLAQLATAEGPYTYDEIKEILAGPEWTAPWPPVG